MSFENNVVGYPFPEPSANPLWREENFHVVFDIMKAMSRMRGMEVPTPKDRYLFFGEMFVYFEKLLTLHVNPFWLNSFFLYTMSRLLDRLTRIYWNVMVHEAHSRRVDDFVPMMLFIEFENNKARDELIAQAAGSCAIRCYVCKGSHLLKNCRLLFSSQVTVACRLQKMAEFNVCLNCLKKNGDGHVCAPPSGRCAKCDQRHDTRFHEDLLDVAGIDLIDRMNVLTIEQ